MTENHFFVYNRFHITNLSELSKQIRDLGLFQFAALSFLEKGAHDSKYPDIYTVTLSKCLIRMTLSSIKFNNRIKEYYYNWEIMDVVNDIVYQSKNSNL